MKLRGLEGRTKQCKTAIEGLGANKSQEAIIRVGKTVGIVNELLIRRIVLPLSVMLIQQSLWLGTLTWLLKSYMTFNFSMYYKKSSHIIQNYVYKFNPNFGWRYCEIMDSGKHGKITLRLMYNRCVYNYVCKNCISLFYM